MVFFGMEMMESLNSTASSNKLEPSNSGAMSQTQLFDT